MMPRVCGIDVFEAECHAASKSSGNDLVVILMAMGPFYW
jgi:hypothetical protein